jgi:hypothetical protein
MICSGCAHKTERGCSALTQIQKDACAFYQTPEESAAGQAKATKRLRSLTLDAQEYIARRFYAGKRVWR